MTNGYRGSGGAPRPGGDRQGQRGDRDGWGERGQRSETPPLDTSGIGLKPAAGGALSPDLFDRVARATAQVIALAQGNKAAQIRQFYDELVMWEEKVRTAPQRFPEFLPFIRMLNAKAAYSRGRGHVDDNFVRLISHCLGQIDDPATLRNFKTFFEAFLGFYKQEERPNR